MLKVLSMLNSAEHEISTAHKAKIPTNKEASSLSLSDAIFIMLVNIKMPKIVGIITL